MSQQEAKRLLEDMLAKEELIGQLQDKGLEEAAEAARGLGYDVTTAELEAEVEERRNAAPAKPVVLAEEELDEVAGGTFWNGETAPDGHEMGCLITYHGKKWQDEHDIKCFREFYCYSHWDECEVLGRTTS